MELQRLTTVYDIDASGLQGGRIQIDAYFAETERRAKDSASRFDKIANEIVKNIGTGIAGGLRLGLGDIGKAVDSLVNIAAAGLKALPVVGSGLSSAFKEVSGVLLDATQRGYAFNDSLKKQQIELALVTGNAAEAKRQLSEIYQIAYRSNIGRSVLADAVQNLELFDVKGQKALDLVRGLANQATATGGGEGQLLSLTDLVDRVLETGTFDRRTVKQFIRNKVPIYDIFAEELRLSKQDAIQKINSGMFSGDDVITILTAYYNKPKWEQAAQDMTQTFEGLATKYQAGVNKLLGVATKPSYDLSTNLLRDANEAIRGPQAGQMAAQAAAAMMPATALLQATENALKSGDIFGGAVSAGNSVVEGFKSGITNKVGDVAEAAKDMGLSAVQSIKHELGIESPSKVFLEIGMNVGDAFAQGMRRSNLSGVRQWTQEQIDFAKKILEIAQQVGATEKQIEAAFDASWVESRFNTLRYGDRDTRGNPQAGGPFQMWPSKGWGAWSQVLDPDYAIRKFFQVAGGVSQAGTPGQLAQRVEASAYPRRYDEQSGTALSLLGTLRDGGPLPTRDDELAGAVRDLAASTNWRNRDGKQFADLSEAQQFEALKRLPGFTDFLQRTYGYSDHIPGRGDVRGGFGVMVDQPQTPAFDPNAPIVGQLNQMIDPGPVVLAASVTMKALQPLAGEFNEIGDNAKDAAARAAAALEKIRKKVTGLRGDLRNLGLTSENLKGIFEKDFSSAFDYIGQKGHNFARDLGLGIAQDIQHNIGEGLSHQIGDVLFGTKDKPGGLLGGLEKEVEKLLGIGGGKSGAAAATADTQSAAVQTNTTATQINTAADNRLTVAVDRLTAAVSRAGVGGATSDRPNPFESEDVQSKIDDVSANVHEAVQSLGKINTGVGGLGQDINTQGFLTVNAIHELGQNLIASMPRGPGLLGTVLGAFASAFGNALGDKLFNSDDEGDGGGTYHTSGYEVDPGTGGYTRPRTVGHRAFGGPVSAGEMYRVNEGNLPEFFRPATSGEVIPLWRMGDYNGGNTYDFSRTVNNSYSQPREQHVRHSGHIELRSPPPTAPVSYRQRRDPRSVKEDILRWLTS